MVFAICTIVWEYEPVLAPKYDIQCVNTNKVWVLLINPLVIWRKKKNSYLPGTERLIEDVDVVMGMNEIGQLGGGGYHW